MTLREYLRRHEGDLIHVCTREESVVYMPECFARALSTSALDMEVKVWNHAPSAEVCSVAINEKAVPFVTCMGGWCYPRLTASLIGQFVRLTQEQLA